MAEPRDEPLEQQTSLPAVLPPEEAELAASEEGNDLAVQESRWLQDTLSKHQADAAALRNEIVRAHIENLNADRGMRKTYAGRILRYLEVYSGGVGALLVLNGFGVGGFSLDETVVATLVGSTAVAAIGLVGFIARGLFRPVPPPPNGDGA